MIRVLVYVVIIFVIAAGAAWLADRPGEVVLNWQGYEIRTSLLLAAAGVLAVMAAIAIVWSLLRAVFRAPRAFGSFLGRRRRDRGYRALNSGIIAVGAGDARLARRAADESRALLGPEPLVLLLSAQAAQLGGDGPGARGAFEALAGRADTRLLGLHGLFVEAQRQDEHEAARHFAEQAADSTPRVAWAGKALFEYAARDGDWRTAVAALDANLQAGLIPADDVARTRAALLTARAMEIESGDPEKARILASEALKLQPGLTPAAVLAARLLTRSGNVRRAAKVLEAAWRVEPHPDLADAYATVRPGDSVRDRMKRMRRLAEIRANHPEGSMAIARAAIDAGDWDAARGALEGLARAPTERVCLLMAEIEEREHGDEGRVRAWLTRALSSPRDPVWMVDGQILDHWLPVSPVTGKVGAAEWKVPPLAPPSRHPVALDAGPFDQPLASVEARPLPRIEHHAAPVAPAPSSEVVAAATAALSLEPSLIEVEPVEDTASAKPAAEPGPPTPEPAKSAPVSASAASPSVTEPVPPRAGPTVAGPSRPEASPAPPSVPVAVASASETTAVAVAAPSEALPAARSEAGPTGAEAAAKPAPQADHPAARPAPTSIRPTALAVDKAAADGKRSKEIDEEEAGPGDRPLILGQPDDPGPTAPDPEDEAARRRFRLF
ncbi:MAG: heme biosynthesis protein HemY [Bauldia sp.]|nr:heme biosynthesis protein HemY [Bauldia sp.]